MVKKLILIIIFVMVVISCSNSNEKLLKEAKNNISLERQFISNYMYESLTTLTNIMKDFNYELEIKIADRYTGFAVGSSYLEDSISVVLVYDLEHSIYPCHEKDPHFSLEMFNDGEDYSGMDSYYCEKCDREYDFACEH